MLVTQWCPTLYDPMDCRSPGSSVHGIFQARILHWVMFSFSRGSSWPRDWTQVSHIAGRLLTFGAAMSLETGHNACRQLTLSDSLWSPWTVACQVPLSTGFFRQNGVGCHFLLQGIFPTQGLNLCLLHSWEAIINIALYSCVQSIEERLELVFYVQLHNFKSIVYITTRSKINTYINKRYRR